MSSLGIDIGGTRTKAAVVDGAGQIVSMHEAPTPCEKSELVGCVRRLLDELSTAETPVAIASPGLAATDNRSIAWMQGRMEAVQGLVWQKELGRETLVINDGHAAALGEAWVGAARGVRNVLMLTLGTGVGGGVLINGELFQGATGRAGHFGHITVDAEGERDIVRTPGSLEDAIGNHNLADRSGGRFTDTAELIAAAQAGDEQAADCWQRSIHCLAAGLASLINAFDPEVIVIGGGVASSGEALFGPLAKAMNRFEWRPFNERVRVVPAELGPLAGALGAARFALSPSQPIVAS